MDNAETKTQAEIVEILHKADTKVNSSWHPIKDGETIQALKKRIMLSDSDIDEAEWEVIKMEALSVLSKCVRPESQPQRETGLVIGYVQSGKTLSFTTVAALARDNGYQMVIVITGTSKILSNQSTQRLEEDLDLHTPPGRWYHIKSHEFNKGKGDHTRIRNVLDDWKDETLDPWERRTVLITVMKNHYHLKNLTNILSKLDLSDVPTLIIDDEGDQASLNTMVKKGKVSPTYQRILSLKECLQYHTFLQYTATPQAPLLINLFDVLSPNFAKVLSPGSKYTGGKAFFQDAQDQICTIPDSEILVKDQQLKGPPESLLEAIRIFILGVSAGRLLDKGSCWSMMVHPSRKTIEHKYYRDWIENVKNNWWKILTLPRDERDRQDLLELFRESYKNLQKTVSNLPSFEELSIKLPSSIRRAEVHEVNASSDGTPPGASVFNAYANILVGGQAMDRGFTVKGLTVTYMSRSKGVGNADTIQQRARFFGYKKEIFKYCRVFLEHHVRDAFEQYIIHEEDIRQSLIEHDKTGKPLDEWIRMFKLNVSLKPTRDSVLDIPYSRIKSGGQWYAPKAPHDSIEEIRTNRSIVKECLNKFPFQEDKGHSKRTDLQTHNEADISLKDVYEELLVPYQVKRPVDLQTFEQLRSEIHTYLESHPTALCKVYHMSKGSLRDRSLSEKEETEAELLGLFQGSSSKEGTVIYPGDRNKKTSGCLTVQIHNFKILKEKIELYSNVPVLTVWLPNEMSQDWLVQNQGGPKIGS